VYKRKIAVCGLGIVKESADNEIQLTKCSWLRGSVTSNQRLICGCDRWRTFIPVIPASGRRHIRGGGGGGCVSLVFSV